MEPDLAHKDSEGNEGQQSPAGLQRSAAGGVRPDPHSAGIGLGEDVPMLASCPSPLDDWRHWFAIAHIAWARRYAPWLLLP